MGTIVGFLAVTKQVWVDEDEGERGEKDNNVAHEAAEKSDKDRANSRYEAFEGGLLNLLNSWCHDCEPILLFVGMLSRVFRFAFYCLQASHKEATRECTSSSSKATEAHTTSSKERSRNHICLF